MIPLCDRAELTENMYNLIKKLYPICRSITGNGVRETLRIIRGIIPIEIHEVPTGTKVFDWNIPKEWNIKEAYVKNSNGDKVIDFNKSNLHILNYSIPVNKKMSLNELKKFLYTLPEYPEVIPYLTSYYKEQWGFCLSHNEFMNLEEDIYEVYIDSELKDGYLTYGEYYIKGRKEEEILFTCYICHPSMCNDNLSGTAMLTYLAKKISEFEELEFSYRFLFIPETIGSITWLSLNEDKIKNIKFGLVATCCGDSGNFTYKKSRKGDTEIDKSVEKVLIDSGHDFSLVEFFPLGSDERQFCSPGFNLSVGSLMRTPYGEYVQYHTSSDNLEFMDKDGLLNTLEMYLNTVYVLENNKKYINLNPKCEPQLGKRGIYSNLGSLKNSRQSDEAMLWILNYSDGENSLLDIAYKSKMSFKFIKECSDLLLKVGLLREAGDDAIL